MILGKKSTDWLDY